ncbi:MAG TPA: cytochrome C oxidase subunit IV family protein [Thermomicrobiales bacterium]|nr:cytochrome C oxidase subunit IV family protein [Thermomicrobiales bacterium]
MAADREAQAHHPSWQEYVKIGVILSIVTAVEVAIVYVEAIEDFLLPMLLGLGAVKFVLVVGYYMHLKQDHKLFTLLFAGGLFLALGVILALMAMFGLMT